MKKFVSMFMAIAMILTCTSFAFAVSGSEDVKKDRSIYVSVTHNDELLEGIKEPNVDEQVYIKNIKASEKKLSFTLKTENDVMYAAEGKLKTVNDNDKFTAAGELLTVDLGGGTEGLIGNLVGELESGTTINLSIHIVPSKQLTFVFITVGNVAAMADTIITYTFGSIFPDMNVMVDALKVGKRALTSEKYSVMAEQLSRGTRAVASDYNTTYRSTGIGHGSYINGTTVELSAVTLFTPKRMKTNSVYKAYVKTNSSEANAFNYIRGTYLVPGVLSVWVSSGACEISHTKDNYMEFTHADPGDESWAIELPIPIYYGGAFSFLPWNLNIGFSTITMTETKNTGSLYVNKVDWKHNYSADVDWGSNGAAATEQGYAGVASITYLQNTSSDYSTQINATGSISYQYVSQFGATQYIGGFTSNTETTSASITVDKFVG